MNFTQKLKGEYNLVITRDGKSTETGWFDNLILNQGLDGLGDTVSVAQIAQVGTGTSTPAVTQVGLDAPIAASPATFYPYEVISDGSPSYTTKYTWRHIFAQGAVVGTIAEVGTSWTAAATGTSFSRALILNDSGTPITISLTAMDQLTVFYRVTLTPSITDTTGTVTIAGTDYDWTLRISNAAGFGAESGSLFQMWNPATAAVYGTDAALSAITAFSISGTANSSPNSQTPDVLAYTAGNYYRDAVYTWTPATGNNDIQGFQFSYGLNGTFRFQMVLDAPLPKDNTKTLTITQRFSWARA
jgi:hypothetical protein